MLNRLYGECISMLEGIGYKPDIAEIRLNNRLSRAYGRYLQDGRIIEINAKVFENASEEQNKTILLHELSHNLDHILNGNISDELEGHGESWQIIAKDITDKLDYQIQRYCPFHVQQNRKIQYFYTYRCRKCGCDKTVQSKFDTEEPVRKGKCQYCRWDDLEFLFPGQYGFNTKNLERIIILNNGHCIKGGK